MELMRHKRWGRCKEQDVLCDLSLSPGEWACQYVDPRSWTNITPWGETLLGREHVGKAEETPTQAPERKCILRITSQSKYLLLHKLKISQLYVYMKIWIDTIFAKNVILQGAKIQQLHAASSCSQDWKLIVLPNLFYSRSWNNIMGMPDFSPAYEVITARHFLLTAKCHLPAENACNGMQSCAKEPCQTVV